MQSSIRPASRSSNGISQKSPFTALMRPRTTISDVFLRIRQFLFGKFGMPNPWGGSTGASSGILMVDRGPSDPYYNSSLAEIKTSAKQRRSIPNFNTLADAVRSLEPSAKAIRLEKLSLKNQARLFKNARVVVMQHGAAMTNVFWMRPGSRVIEIGPARRAARLSSALPRSSESIMKSPEAYAPRARQRRRGHCGCEPSNPKRRRCLKPRLWYALKFVTERLDVFRKMPFG